MWEQCPIISRLIMRRFLGNSNSCRLRNLVKVCDCANQDSFLLPKYLLYRLTSSFNLTTNETTIKQVLEQCFPQFFLRNWVLIRLLPSQTTLAVRAIGVRRVRAIDSRIREVIPTLSSKQVWEYPSLSHMSQCPVWTDFITNQRTCIELVYVKGYVCKEMSTCSGGTADIHNMLENITNT